jgi:hypothetical protein
MRQNETLFENYTEETCMNEQASNAANIFLQFFLIQIFLNFKIVFP